VGLQSGFGQDTGYSSMVGAKFGRQPPLLALSGIGPAPPVVDVLPEKELLVLASIFITKLLYHKSMIQCTSSPWNVFLS
jgi:hypothetical protein